MANDGQTVTRKMYVKCMLSFDSLIVAEIINKTYLLFIDYCWLGIKGRHAPSTKIQYQTFIVNQNISEKVSVNICSKTNS